jgi:hypothetical protein
MVREVFVAETDEEAMKQQFAVIDARVHYAYPGRRLSDHAALAATCELAAARR